jgi:hypothetical protein
MEEMLLTDNDWSIVADKLCRVRVFTPMATIQEGKILTLGVNAPYASVTLECKKLLDTVQGTISHSLDFRNLWTAFYERSLEKDEEVLIIWSKTHYKGYAKKFSGAMPRLWVMVSPKEAYELETDKNFRPELRGEARWKAVRPRAQWKPDVME